MTAIIDEDPMGIERKARSVGELAVHGLWETKEGPVCDFWRP